MITDRNVIPPHSLLATIDRNNKRGDCWKSLVIHRGKKKASNLDTQIRKLARKIDVAGGQFIILMQITGTKIKARRVVRRINRNLARHLQQGARRARPC